ncbi:helix-turn-helix transcriptional regulator [Dyadobacter flavalbus]|uniref:Helix-turn-helix transcriptional regulator n=1 Tax=Dyadobacter flavalbus TaxID=2579942 RepID=A0A5M8QYM6_9BACT|nr:AraC family transcriptional regulator [Dyadobacter flavalbus]KAA6441395.1 helix-turn-helix transcriptional regulator [Dyadobacter flavalbus]
MIKAQFENLYPHSHASFIVNAFTLEKFDVPYHFHPQYELTLIVKGSGKRFVGKNMAGFDSGDLVFLGSDLPHSWKSENTVRTETVQSVVVQFEKNFLGPEFFDKPELAEINNLLKMSVFGIQFIHDGAAAAGEKMKLLAGQKNAFRKMTMLLEILYDLAKSGEYILLDQDATIAQQHNSHKERINAALGYIVDNFRNDIVLNKVASLANMSPNAFCKYFKKMTNKTFVETVIDYRISFAVQQLIATDKAVSEIALESGFGDISHFYKLFKKRMNMSPLNYRNSFQKSL